MAISCVGGKEKGWGEWEEDSRVGVLISEALVLGFLSPAIDRISMGVYLCLSSGVEISDRVAVLPRTVQEE